VTIPSLQVTILALAISFIFLAARSVSIFFSTLRSDLARERSAMTAIYGRGLAAAILSVLPAQYGLPNSGVYTIITLLVIVFTTVVTSLGATRFRISSETVTRPFDAETAGSRH
jgi:NhaP-type Na+/H+ and K+/H+ antiporter